ncbi:hypothetical protein GXW74_06750 [Roseomonas eburnea]|uniref:Uncharacterized protein n=1 Tax=Neoroseomonas eburnea TaxID=1346889 RepID=A0A9X9X8Z3_9PROT|nr:hypothetical protein [Neoroseomonas eburnea]MBR0680179.1 hypothetical protein [Neoroseomonas eburnea]
MSHLSRRLTMVMPLLAASALPAAAQAPAVMLFRVVSPRDEIIIGLTQAELAALGTGPEAERIARKLVADGQVGAWRYVVGRAPDGSTRHAAAGRVAILRQETYRIEPYTPALPVAPPPG